MSETMLEKADATLAEAAHKMAQCTNAFADTLEDGLRAAKRVGKHTSDAAEEFIEDTEQRIKRHPAESLATAFVAGFLIGGALSWLLRRR
jgi:ElaB/YqjD/DUF883 family membrane-anchored ribosome-binding protein